MIYSQTAPLVWLFPNKPNPVPVKAGTPITFGPSTGLHVYNINAVKSLECSWTSA